MSAFAGPEPKPGILNVHAYVPGKSGPKTGKVHKLSSNESPMGPSPKAVSAYQEAVSQNLALYPDPSATKLRDAIAKRYGLNAANIVCGGTGSDELLQMLAHAYLGVGDEAIYSQFGFLVYPIAIATGNLPHVGTVTGKLTRERTSKAICIGNALPSSSRG